MWQDRMTNLQGCGLGVPDPLPVYRSDSDDSRPEQVGTLRIRGLEAPLDSRGLGKSELQDNFRVRCAARCWSINTGHKAPIARLYYQ